MNLTSIFRQKVNARGLRGFTLVELIIIVAIIGILSSIAIVNLNDTRAKGRDAVRLSAIDNLLSALRLYYTDNRTWPVQNLTAPENFYPDTGAQICTQQAGGWSSCTSRASCLANPSQEGSKPTNKNWLPVLEKGNRPYFPKGTPRDPGEEVCPKNNSYDPPHGTFIYQSGPDTGGTRFVISYFLEYANSNAPGVLDDPPCSRNCWYEINSTVDGEIVFN